MSYLAETTLPRETVAALAKLNIDTVWKLMDCTGEFIQSKLSGHYVVINEWVTSHRFVQEDKRAKQKGQKQRACTEAQALKMLKLQGSGWSTGRIARKFRIAKSTAYDTIQRAKKIIS